MKMCGTHEFVELFTPRPESTSQKDRYTLKCKRRVPEGKSMKNRNQ